MAGVSGRLGAEEGVTAAEYVGFGVVIAAVAVALFALDPSLADRLRSPIDDQVCDVLRADCEGERLPAGDRVAGGGASTDDTAASGRGAGAEPAPPSVVCSVATDGRTLGANVTVIVVSADGELGYTVTERSNGTYDVTLLGSGGLGLELIKGASAESGGTGVGVSGAVGVIGSGRVETTFRFEDEATARAFVDESTRALSGTLHGSGQAVSGILTQNPWNLVQGIYRTITGSTSWDPPPPVKTVVEGQVTVGADGSYGGGTSKVKGALEAGAVLGSEVDHVEGQTKVYVRIDADAAVAAGLLPVASGSAGTFGDVVLALTVRNDDGRPVELAIAHTMELSGNVDIPAVTAAVALAEGGTPGLKSALGEATGLLEHQDSVSVQTTARLDLMQPAEDALAGEILRALTTRPPIDIGTAGTRVARHIADTTTLEVEVWSGTRDIWGFDVRAGAGPGGGLGISSRSDSNQLLSAMDRAPRGSFVLRNCGNGP